MKTSELTGRVLDWAVSVAHRDAGFVPVEYSTKWEFGGPIIERERIELRNWDFHSQPWRAEIAGSDSESACYGPTPLIAAMRCYVASKLGDSIDIPEELL